MVFDNPQVNWLSGAASAAPSPVVSIDTVAPEIALHPLNDRDEWVRAPMYEAPKDVDIVQTQKWIDSMMGTTRNNESIYKLVWNGDAQYWHEFYMQWDALGKPSAPVVKRPRVRHKALRDDFERLVRDVFPPRWLILSRLEPEQFAASWKSESYLWAPEINNFKQMRPDEAPDVFWLHYMTIAEHSDYCCATAEKESRKCFGKYAPPSQAREALGQQKQFDTAAGIRSVFEKVDTGFVDMAERELNGYKGEIARLRVQSEVYLANPMALIGPHAAMKAGVETEQDARRIVSDHLNRRFDELSKLI